MTTIYRVYVNRGLRAKTEVGFFADETVANYVAANTKLLEGQTASIEAVLVDDAGTVEQYVADQQLARLKTLLTPEEIALLARRGGVI
jgi:hypothetical protein